MSGYKLKPGRKLEAEADGCRRKETAEERCPVACSVCLLKAYRTFFQALPTMIWSLPHELLIKSKFHRLAHKPFWWRHFPNFCSFFHMFPIRSR